jgi:hypothetical protein
MQFRGEEYYQAGIERMQQAWEIHGSGKSYALAMYCGGLAVECILRVFRWTKDPSFEGRHNLQDLFKASDLRRIHAERARTKGMSEEEVVRSVGALANAMSEVDLLWHNNLRFASEAGLRAFLRRNGRLQGIKGNALKKNSSDLLRAAELAVEQGVAAWISKKKSRTP